jgi:phosphoribosyl 1,2-cyclic phosphate phosphodiesterase
VRVEILGSADAVPTPRPGCDCRVCTAAREHGGRHVRTGPSVFLHGPNVLFDTPEESRLQLERAGIGEIAACLYSHGHPDHTMGRRVWETVNRDFRAWPRRIRGVTPVYHIEEFDGLTYDDHVRLGAELGVEFAYDGMQVEI